MNKPENCPNIHVRELQLRGSLSVNIKNTMWNRKEAPKTIYYMVSLEKDQKSQNETIYN